MSSLARSTEFTRRTRSERLRLRHGRVSSVNRLRLERASWTGASRELKSKLNAILHEQERPSLHVTRIARIYDGRFGFFMLKPDRLRYWLRSVALRDADETLADLRAQGF